MSLLLCFAGATACGGDDSPGETPTPTKTVTETTEAPAETEPAAEQAVLPNLVGKSLQDAQDTAQANGFYLLDSRDATGMDRFQVLDRNWVVCSQMPEPGRHPTDVTVTFDVVKDDESCP
ncbi:PASTA domain-containing protein [Streptomyces sp. NBC_01381]|uniref:PASTA domain-containing protein n=1 Tax=Streptomyces sp. NBC_01381 TaxID=2903845 RepID=UPI0022558237|nr:PASTA domain-containing protein [Streptomyces sp. NBC_01381]MCX4671830.1 PASTA domain-containing protein [Streptomyces sp. NBC_01381]